MRYRRRRREIAVNVKPRSRCMPRTRGNATDEAAEGQTIQTVNPATGENGKAYRPHTIDEARSIAADCAAVQKQWRQTPIRERGQLMHAAARVLRANKDRYASLMTEEM